MRRGLAVWPVIAATFAIAISALTGCTVHGCAGPAQFPPSVWLDPSPWLAQHPESTLTACLGGNCKTADAATAVVVQLVIPAQSPEPDLRKSGFDLTITSHGSTPLKVHARVRLYESQVTGLCGTHIAWHADARVDRTGHLTIWRGVPGPFAPQIARSSTPTAHMLRKLSHGWG